jgi:hypothetical protein
MLCSLKSVAQDSIQLTVVPTWNNNPISLHSSYKLNDNVIIEISQLKFYLSNVRTSSIENTSNYHLLDLADNLSFSFKIPSENSGQLLFNLGVDSVTNSQGAQGGDLDPMKGMYWTWQSGYINLKLEGNYSKQFTGAEEFTFHLGGYSGRKNAIQLVQLEIEPEQKEITLEMNLATFFNRINVIEQNMIMSPSVKAVEMSKTMAGIFSVERK